MFAHVHKLLALLSGALFVVAFIAIFAKPLISGSISHETKVVREGEFSYIARLKPESGPPLTLLYELRGEETGRPSDLVVLDWNSTPLDRPHSAHADIRTKGDGRYQHWNNHLYFSTVANVPLPQTYTLTWSARAKPKGWLRLLLAFSVIGVLVSSLMMAGPPVLRAASMALRSRLKALWPLPRGAVVVLAAICSALILAVVNRPVVTGAISEQTPITREGDFGYLAKLHPESRTLHTFFYELRGEETGRLSDLVVVDWNSTPLDKPHSPHAEIRAKGNGRYQIWNDDLYFSTIDNVPLPETFSLRWSVPAEPKAWLFWLLGASLAVLLLSLATHWRLRSYSVKWLVAGSLVLLFIFTRLVIHVGYYMPNFTPDSAGYFDPAFRIATDQWPIFSMRTPAYPLFLFASLAVANIKLIILIQQLATLISGMALYLALTKGRDWLAIPSGITVAGLFADGTVVLHEVSLIPEALYTASIVASVAGVIYGVTARRPVPFAVASLMMATAILLRPSAMFFVVLAPLLMAGLYLYRYPRSCLAALAIPLAASLLIASAYNRVTIGQFTISAWGPVNIAGATSTFWADSTSYPPAARKAIAQMNSMVTDQEREILASSWNPRRLSQIYDRYYDVSVYQVLASTAGTDIANPQIAKLLDRIGWDAVRAHPTQYLKFVSTSAYMFFWRGPQSYYSYASSLPDRYKELYLPSERIFFSDNEALKRYALSEVIAAGPPKHFYVTRDEETTTVTVRRTALYNVHEAISAGLFPVIFNGKVWFWGVVGFLGMVAFAWLRGEIRKLVSADVLLSASVTGLTLLGAGLIVSLVQRGIDRYSYPTRFLYFLALPILVWLCVDLYRAWLWNKRARGSCVVAKRMPLAAQRD